MKTTFGQVGFPDSQAPRLGPALKELFRKCQILSTVILKCLSLALGKEATYLEGLHCGALKEGGEVVMTNLTTLRLNHYPAIQETKTNMVRCGHHTDYGTITLLFQVTTIIQSHKK